MSQEEEAQLSANTNELNLKSLVQTLREYNGGENFHIEAIYLFGSRLYGIANTYVNSSLEQTPVKSDYDFIIITNRKADEKEGINRNNKLPSDSRTTLELICGQNQMDCVVMDVSHFLMDVFIEQHNYKSILPLWLENGEFVWFESNLMRWIRTYWMALLNIRLRQIQRGLTLWCKITAKRSFIDGDLRRARKNLLHSIRYLKYAIHITNDKKITKYRNAKKFHELFFEKTKEFNLWREYEEMFRPIHKLFKSRLNDGCYELFKNSQTLSNEISNEIIEKSIPTTVFIEYCKKYGITELSRHFSIVVSPLFESLKEKEDNQSSRNQISPTASTLIDGTYIIPQYESIIDLIKRESFISTKLVKIITHREVHKRLDDLIPLQECWNGSIIEMQPPSDWNCLSPDSTNIKLIAQPYKYFFQYDSDACDNIIQQTNTPLENQTIQVTKKYVGTMCMLFYYDNEWRISTNQSKDWEYLYTRNDPSIANDNEIQTSFWKTFKELGYELPTDSDKCFIFTLSSIPFLSSIESGSHQSNFSRELIAHGCRDMLTLKEESIQPHAEKYNWKYPEIIDIIPKAPYFDIIEKTKYKPKKRPLNANLWRKKPDDICVNLPLFGVFEKYMELANDFTTLDPERHSGFILCDQDFVRIKIETAIYYNMSYLELFRDSETQETSVDSENNQMYIIEMVRNLKSFLSESVQDLVQSGGDLSTLTEMTTDLQLVKYYVPEFFNLYVEYRNLYKITCNLMNVVYSKIQQIIQQEIQNGTLKESDINKVYPDLAKDHSPLSRTFPLMYMRKNQIDNCFNLFTRKSHLHTEAIHGLMAECRQKMNKVIPFLVC